MEQNEIKIVNRVRNALISALKELDETFPTSEKPTTKRISKRQERHLEFQRNLATGTWRKPAELKRKKVSND